MVFVAVFTVRSYRMGNNPRQAIIEAWVNIVFGFSLNYIANIFLLPLVGAELTASNNFWLGWAYTAVSIMRQYAIRRWFQERMHIASIWIAKHL